MEKQMQAWMQTIHQLVSPEELERLTRKTGFIQRKRSLTPEANGGGSRDESRSERNL